MRFFLLLSVLCVSQVFAHKGMLREEAEFLSAHNRGEDYEFKPGFVFKDQVMEQANTCLFNSAEWQNIDLTGDQNCFYGNQEVPAENLKRAVRKVFADRYHASRPDGEGFFVNMTQFICDPNVPLWSSLPTTNKSPNGLMSRLCPMVRSLAM